MAYIPEIGFNLSFTNKSFTSKDFLVSIAISLLVVLFRYIISFFSFFSYKQICKVLVYLIFFVSIGLCGFALYETYIKLDEENMFHYALEIVVAFVIVNVLDFLVLIIYGTIRKPGIVEKKLKHIKLDNLQQQKQNDQVFQIQQSSSSSDLTKRSLGEEDQSVSKKASKKVKSLEKDQLDKSRGLEDETKLEKTQNYVEDLEFEEKSQQQENSRIKQKKTKQSKKIKKFEHIQMQPKIIKEHQDSKQKQEEEEKTQSTQIVESTVDQQINQKKQKIKGLRKSIEMLKEEADIIVEQSLNEDQQKKSKKKKVKQIEQQKQIQQTVIPAAEFPVQAPNVSRVQQMWQKSQQKTQKVNEPIVDVVYELKASNNEVVDLESYIQRQENQK